MVGCYLGVKVGGRNLEAFTDHAGIVPTELVMFVVDVDRNKLLSPLYDSNQLTDSPLAFLFLDVPEAFKAGHYLAIAEGVVFTRHW